MRSPTPAPAAGALGHPTARHAGGGPTPRDQRGQASAFVVSTDCPTCGAALDFAQGSNAVRCCHCASNLLVTGRGQVLSYVVTARVSGAEARSLARFALGEAASRSRVGEPRLWLVPYYRLTATELRWQRRAPDEAAERRRREQRTRRVRPRAVPLPVAAGEWLEGGPYTLEGESRSARRAAVEFAGRRLERNLLASPSGPAPPSLGVRPSVLRLELFRSAALPAGAIACACEIDPLAALREAIVATGDDEILERSVVGRTLSVVHFPHWVVPVDRAEGRHLVVVDGVSASVVDAAAAPEAIDRMPAVAGEPPIAGFRPLACPNCGWDLPVSADDVVFHCTGCDRDWLVAGDRLEREEATIVAAPRASRRQAFDHRPFWVVPRAAWADGAAAGGVESCLVPAFRHANLKRLHDLALRLSRRAPALEPSGERGREMSGCVLDGADAVDVARFIAAGRDRNGRPLLDAPPAAPCAPDAAAGGAARPRLVWLPFLRDAYGWRDPFTGTALPPEIPA